MPTTVRKSVDQRWQEQFERLVEFKRAYGHCLVPPKYPPDKTLGNLVAIQRGKFKHGRLRPEYEKKLRDIGFPFNLQFQLSKT